MHMFIYTYISIYLYIIYIYIYIYIYLLIKEIIEIIMLINNIINIRPYISFPSVKLSFFCHFFSFFFKYFSIMFIFYIHNNSVVSYVCFFVLLFRCRYVTICGNVIALLHHPTHLV